MIKWPKEYKSEDYRRVASELMHMGDDPAIEDVYQLGLGEAAHMLELIASQSEATPTIPAGYRVVPYALPDDAVIFGDDDDDGYRMGWNACRNAMLAASPSAGGV